MKKHSCSIIILIILLSVLQLNSQTKFWEQSNGPYGGFTTSVVADSIGNQYVGTNGSGVFYSTNEGMNWEPCNTGLTNLLVTCLGKSHKGFIFAGTEDGLFKSSNSGISWSQSNNGVFRSIFVTSNNIVLTGTYGGGISRSTDNGESWNQASTGLNNLFIHSFEENQQGEIFAGTETDYYQTVGGIYRSTDEGKSWASITAPMYVTALNVDSFNNIYAGTYRGNLYKSTNDGNSWFIPDSSLPSAKVSSIENDQNGNLFVAIWGYGLFCSTNHGSSWTLCNEGLTNKYINSIFINNLDHLFIGSNGGGFFYSANSGKTWTQSNTGIINTSVFAISINKNGYLFAGTGHYVSNYFYEGSGLFRSTNQGQSWNNLNNGLESVWIHSIIYDSSDNYFVGASDGVYKSIDFGNTWNQTLTQSTGINALAISPKQIIYAGSYRGVFCSSDKGKTWSSFGTGLTDKSVNCLAASRHSEYIFAGTGNYTGIAEGKVFRTTDSSNIWSETSFGLVNTYINALAFDSDDNIYAGTYNYGLFCSTNHGESWQGIGLTGFSIQSIAINSENEIYVSGYDASGSSVYRSTNQGVNWTKIVEGLTSTDVFALAFDSLGYIFAGTFNQGLFKSNYSTTDITKLVDKNVTTFYLSQNFPNPFNPNTKIEFSIPEYGFVKVEVYDALGRKVKELLNQELSAGNYSVDFDASDLSSGVYYYRLTTKYFVQMKKAVLLK